MKLTKPAAARMTAGFAAYPGVRRTSIDEAPAWPEVAFMMSVHSYAQRSIAFLPNPLFSAVSADLCVLRVASLSLVSRTTAMAG